MPGWDEGNSEDIFFFPSFFFLVWRLNAHNGRRAQKQG